MKAQVLPARPAKPRLSLDNATDRHAPIAIRKILIPTDFSPASENGLRYALRLANEFGAHLTLLNVLEPIVPPTFEGLPMQWPSIETESAETNKALKDLVALLGKRGTSHVKVLARRGIASQEIVDTAKELDVDLIVIATHGFTGWKHFCMGSTAERVARVAPCPVLVVREKEHEFI